MHYHWKHPFAIGDKVRCFAPEGWGGHQGNLLDQVAYFGEGLDEYGMPKHGTLYCVRGFDHTSAVTFDSAETIRNVMAEWDGLGSLPSDMIFPEVEDADGDGYATEAECVAAGVDPWISPNDEVSRAHLNTKQDGA